MVTGKQCKMGCNLVVFISMKSRVGFPLVSKSVTLSGILTSTACYVCLNTSLAVFQLYLHLKICTSLYFYLFHFAVILWHQKYNSIDVLAVCVNVAFREEEISDKNIFHLNVYYECVCEGKGALF